MLNHQGPWGTAIKFFLLAALIIALAVLWHLPAKAAPQRCGNYTAIIASLATKYSEAPKAVGILNNNVLMIVFVSASGGWTIISKTTTDYSCILLTGLDWQDVPWKPGKKT